MEFLTWEPNAKEAHGMPKEILLKGLESADRVAESLEKVEEDLRLGINNALNRGTHKIGQFLEGMKGTALAFENAWRTIVINVAKGQTAEMQAERTGLLSEFDKRIDILKKGHAFLTGEHHKGYTDLDPDFLLPEIADMQRFKTRVLDRWQSADDLEKLAVEQYPLAQSQLKKIAASHTPPPEWYQGEEEQLFQE